MSVPDQVRAWCGPDKSRRAAFALLNQWHAVGLATRGVRQYGGGPNDIVTTVMRLASPALSSAMETLTREFPDHYWYPSTAIHITVLRLRNGIDPHRLAVLLANEPEIPATVRGLRISRDTVYTCVFPDRRRLALLRRRVAAEFGVPLRHFGLDLAHANVARFRNKDVFELRRQLVRHRHTAFGTATFGSVLLARTDKTFTATQTTILAELYLDR